MTAVRDAVFIKTKLQYQPSSKYSLWVWWICRTQLEAARRGSCHMALTFWKWRSCQRALSRTGSGDYSEDDSLWHILFTYISNQQQIRKEKNNLLQIYRFERPQMWKLPMATWINVSWIHLCSAVINFLRHLSTCQFPFRTFSWTQETHKICVGFLLFCTVNMWYKKPISAIYPQLTEL